MNNWHSELALTYHEETKHSYQSLLDDRHFLDWGNQPQPLKSYRGLEAIPLPAELQTTQMPALRTLAPLDPMAARTLPVTLPDLAYILFAAAGITRRRTYPGYGEMLFRAAACTGALYHIDLYIVTAEMPGLRAGVYHFDPRDFAVRQLRAGDYRQVLVEASGDNPALCEAPVLIVGSDTFWRNTWKYRARAYRHSFWDTGTILANLLAAATARGLPAHLVLGFVDASVNALLDIETPREVALVLVGLGAGAPPATMVPAMPALHLDVAPLSAEEHHYHALEIIHAASVLEAPDEALEWREVVATHGLPEATGAIVPLAPTSVENLPPAVLEAVIRRRGSARGFTSQALSLAQLSNVLVAATQPIPADYLATPGSRLNDLYCLINAVEGVASGSYVWHPASQALELLAAGASRKEAGTLALGQDLAEEASVLVFALCDLLPIVERLGNRGYRAAQLEAGLMGGRMYLAAYAQGLGATGLTFLDDDVTEYFAPHAAAKSVMFLLAMGYTARR